METLNAYAKNIYSQRGEDGIIARLLELIGDTPRWCVEFGAWDGKHLSNTHALMERGWSGVFIEGDSARFQDLQRTYAGNVNAYPICVYIGFRPPTDLDSILAETPLPKDFSVLSIDIDGNDYHVWESLGRYRPRIVVIEFNPTIPSDIEFIQPKDSRLNQGNSLRALINLGKRKEYELAATTSLNAIFVRRDLFSLVGIPDNSTERLFTDRSSLMEVFQLYDGTLIFTGKHRMFWHGIELDRFQPIPKFFRIFPPNMSRTKSLLFRVWRRIVNR